MKLKMIGVLALTAMILAPAFGDDDAKPKRKGKKNRGRQGAGALLVKQLEPVGLTDDQVAKIKVLGKKAAEEMIEIRKAAGITPELAKKRIAAQKSMKDSGKKGKELSAAINEAAGFSTAQVEAQKKSNAVRIKFHKDAIALLSEEQKGKLPERLQRSARAGKRGQGKKKKRDAA